MSANTAEKSTHAKRASRPPKTLSTTPAGKPTSKAATLQLQLGASAHPSLHRMTSSKKNIRLSFDSLADLHLQTLALTNHIERLEAPISVDGTTYLGREGAEAIVSDCSGSDDLTLTVAQCGKTGRGMQQCVGGELNAQGYDPTSLHLNILDTDYLDTIVTEIAKAAK